uniref:Uncharacterized protein n=1 Tax=Arundo donax TaxID=35708 RepID=A0A0A8YTU8_ARUDO
MRAELMGDGSCKLGEAVFWALWLVEFLVYSCVGRMPCATNWNLI